MIRRLWKRASQYLLAVIYVAMAVACTRLLGQVAVQNEFVLFVTAVIVATWFGGLGPGMTATLLSTLAINYFVFPGTSALTPSYDLARLTLFVIVCSSIAWLDQSRKFAEERLRANEALFRVLVEGVSDYAIILLDPLGVIRTWNTGAERITGYTAAQAIGRNYELLYSQEDRQTGKPLRVLELAVHNGRYEEEGWRVRNDGRLYWAGSVITPILNANSTVTGYAKITRDLTDRLRSEERDRKNQAEMTRLARFATLNELAAGIAHELNQPLAAISLYTQGLLDRLRDDPSTRPDTLSALESARAQAKRATDVVAHYRQLIRRRTPSRAPTQMNELLTAVSGLLASDLRRANVELVVHLPEKTPAVMVDAIEIEQVLINLVRNAIDALATVERQRSIHIVVPTLGDGFVAVDVTDNGPGMSAEEIQLAFEPFHTTKPEGLGLGLAISRGIIESHNGRLTCSSQPGKGTTFRFTLPIA